MHFFFETPEGCAEDNSDPTKSGFRKRRSIWRDLYINRYRRWVETCLQAKTSNSGHAIFFFFFWRVRATSMTQRRVANTRVHFWTFPPVLVNEIWIWNKFWALADIAEEDLYILLIAQSGNSNRKKGLKIPYHVNDVLLGTIVLQRA